jgi:hypothetical protein
MPRSRAAWLLLLAALGASAEARAAGGQGGVLAGKVTGRAPRIAAVEDALVYVYQVGDASLRRATTDLDGHFTFDLLPAGLYKLIAYKAGFLPVVVKLTRASAEARQFLDLQLAEEQPGAALRTGDFWSLREQIPPDVLREIETVERPYVAYLEPAATRGAGAFQTEMMAMTGVDDELAQHGAALTSGRVGIQGRVGELRIGLSGDFSALQANSFEASTEASASSGQARTVSLRVESSEDSLFDITSLNNRLVTEHSGKAFPVEFEHYRVSWSGALGAGRSEFAAQYTSETNFYRNGWVSALAVPDASQTWRLEGSYARDLGGHANLRTGLRYRQRYGQYLGASRFFESAPEEDLEVYGLASSRLRPAMVVEYGLYTRLRDGRLSLSPRGGLVLNLGPVWEAAADATVRLQDDAQVAGLDFVPALYSDREACEQAEEHCYRLVLTRTVDDGNTVALTAIHRRLGESQRLYFSEQFFDYLENLFLVPGDDLPELQLAVDRQVTPNVRTRFESAYAAGGGGVFQASQRRRYENQVRYLVTSLDTRFEPTATGVFVAFHRLEQSLDPLGSLALVQLPTSVELESLEVSLSQDLNVVLDLAADWAVHLDMELSRGGSPRGNLPEDEIRRRILGGIAVRF